MDVCCYHHDGRGGNGIYENHLLSCDREQANFETFATRLRENINPQTPILFYNSLLRYDLYSRRDIGQYAQEVNELKQPVFLLMWEEDWKRLRKKNALEMLDVSEGRGPVAKHRLILVKPSGFLPIPAKQESAVLRREREDSAND